MQMKAEYKTIFAEEARDHVEEWEQSLLRLEHTPGDRELIHGMFRAIHTLKGSSGFIGFDKLQKVTHRLESALQDVRDGNASLTPAVLERLFQGLDLAKRMVASFQAGEEFQESIDEFLATLAAPEAPQQPAPAAVGVQETSAWKRRFQLEVSIKSTGREAFLRAFLIRKRLTGIAAIVSEDPAPETLAGSKGPFAYTLILDTDQEEADLQHTLLVDQLRIASMRQIPRDELLPSSATPTVLTVSGAPAVAAPAAPVVAAPVVAAPAAAAPVVATPVVAAPSATASAVPAPSAASGAAETRAFKGEDVVRVSVERLDALLNLVGELVIQNSGFHSVGEQLRNKYRGDVLVVDLQSKTEALTKVTRDLQDGIMKVRMLPVNNVFTRFHRVVRDLAKDHGKEITLETFGEETEIDKKVMDRIAEPLLHTRLRLPPPASPGGRVAAPDGAPRRTGHGTDPQGKRPPAHAASRSAAARRAAQHSGSRQSG